MCEQRHYLSQTTAPYLIYWDPLRSAITDSSLLVDFSLPSSLSIDKCCSIHSMAIEAMGIKIMSIDWLEIDIINMGKNLGHPFLR